MLNELPEVYQGIGYYQGFSLILWIITIVLFFMGSILFIIKALKVDIKETQIGFLGMANYSLFFGLGRIFYIIAVYDPDNYDFHTNLGYIFSVISIIFVLYLIETHFVTSTKKIFTIITLVTLIITVISLIGMTSRYLALTVLYIMLPFSIGSILLLYIYVVIKSAGKVRTKAALIFLSLTIIFLAHMMDSEMFISNLPFIPLEVTPMIMMVGVIILPYAYIFYKTK